MKILRRKNTLIVDIIIFYTRKNKIKISLLIRENLISLDSATTIIIYSIKSYK